jgi:hypothetical protein
MGFAWRLVYLTLVGPMADGISTSPSVLLEAVLEALLEAVLALEARPWTE